MSHSVAGTPNNLIDTYTMDRGRVIFEVPIVTIPDPTLDRIAQVLQDAEIFFGVKSTTYGLCNLDIPIMTVIPASSDKMIKIVINALSPHLAPGIGEEILSVWEDVPQTPYFTGTSEGFAPPENKNDLQTFLSGSVPFQPLPLPFQNVLLYDRYRNHGYLSELKPGKDHKALIAAASKSDFLSTPENNRLVPGSFTHENLLPRGSDGLNPIELTLRSRNAALTRAMLGTTTFDRHDHRFNRAILNAILREIEHCSQLEQPQGEQTGENPKKVHWAPFLDWLKQKKFMKNLSADQQNELNLYLGRLSEAAVDIYAFLMIIFTPFSGFSDQSMPSPIWVQFARPETSENQTLPGPFNGLESNLMLASTLGAFILDRCLKFMINADPKMKDKIEKKILKITTAASDSGAMKSMIRHAKEIVNDPTSEVSKMMEDLLSKTPVSRKMKEVGEMLGPHFVENYGSQWKSQVSTEKEVTSLDIFLDGLDSCQQKRYGDVLQKKGLKNFRFEKIKNSFRLIVSMTIEVEMIQTNGVSASTSSVEATVANGSSASSNSSEDVKPAIKLDISHFRQLAEQFLAKAREAWTKGDATLAGKSLDHLASIDAEAIALVQASGSAEHPSLLKDIVDKGRGCLKKGDAVKAGKYFDLLRILDPEGSALVPFKTTEKAPVTQSIADKVRECVRDAVKLRKHLVFFFNLDSEGCTSIKIKGLDAEERVLLAQAALDIVSDFIRDKKAAQASRCIDLFASLETESSVVVKPEEMALLAQLLVEKARDFLKRNEAGKAGRCLDFLITFNRVAIASVQTKEFPPEEQASLAQGVLEKALDFLKKKQADKVDQWLDLLFILEIEGKAFAQIKGFSPVEKTLLVRAVVEKVRASLKQEGAAKIGNCLDLLFVLDSDDGVFEGLTLEEKKRLALPVIEALRGFIQNKRSVQVRRCLDLLATLETDTLTFERDGEFPLAEKELLAKAIVGKAREFVTRKETVKAGRCFDLLLVLGLEGSSVLLKSEEQTVLVQAVIDKVRDFLKKGDKSKGQKCLDLLFMLDPEGSSFDKIGGIPAAEKALLADAYFDKMEVLMQKGDATKAGKCLLLIKNLDSDNRALLAEGRVLCETLGGIKFVDNYSR